MIVFRPLAAARSRVGQRCLGPLAPVARPAAHLPAPAAFRPRTLQRAAQARSQSGFRPPRPRSTAWAKIGATALVGTAAAAAGVFYIIQPDVPDGLLEAAGIADQRWVPHKYRRIDLSGLVPDDVRTTLESDMAAVKILLRRDDAEAHFDEIVELLLGLLEASLGHTISHPSLEEGDVSLVHVTMVNIISLVSVYSERLDEEESSESPSQNKDAQVGYVLGDGADMALRPEPARLLLMLWQRVEDKAAEARTQADRDDSKEAKTKFAEWADAEICLTPACVAALLPSERSAPHTKLQGLLEKAFSRLGELEEMGESVVSWIGPDSGPTVFIALALCKLFIANEKPHDAAWVCMTTMLRFAGTMDILSRAYADTLVSKHFATLVQQRQTPEASVLPLSDEPRPPKLVSDETDHAHFGELVKGLKPDDFYHMHDDDAMLLSVVFGLDSIANAKEMMEALAEYGQEKTRRRWFSRGAEAVPWTREKRPDSSQLTVEQSEEEEEAWAERQLLLELYSEERVHGQIGNTLTTHGLFVVLLQGHFDNGCKLIVNGLWHLKKAGEEWQHQLDTARAMLAIVVDIAQQHNAELPAVPEGGYFPDAVEEQLQIGQGGPPRVEDAV